MPKIKKETNKQKSEKKEPTLGKKVISPPPSLSENSSKENVVWTSGRRKTAVARIRLGVGKGTFLVNGKEMNQYFPSSLEQELFFSPFATAGRSEKGFDLSLKLAGGGKHAQLEASVLAIAKALNSLEPELKAVFKKKGLLTRDSRMKERKKYGLRRARRAPQFSKR